MLLFFVFLFFRDQIDAGGVWDCVYICVCE